MTCNKMWIAVNPNDNDDIVFSRSEPVTAGHFFVDESDYPILVHWRMFVLIEVSDDKFS